MKVVHPVKPAPVAVVAPLQFPAMPAPSPPPESSPEQKTPAIAEPEPPPAIAAEPVKPARMPPVRLSAPRDVSKLQRVRTVASLATANPVPTARPAPVEPAKPSPMPPEIPKPPRMRTMLSTAAANPALVTHPAQSAQVGAAAPSPPTTAVPPPPVTTEPEHATPEPPQQSVDAASADTAPQPHQVTLNAGLILPVRLVGGLSSERNAPGDVFAATLDKEVVADGFVIAERGARVEGRVVAVDRAKVRASALALELISLHTSDGQTVSIVTDGFFKHANAAQVDTTTKIAGGVIVGAGIGGGAGAGDALLTRRPAELSSETLVKFKLRNSVPLTEKLH